MHYLKKVENGGMLSIYACWGGLKAYRRGVYPWPNFFFGENAEKTLIFGGWEGINVLSHQCIGEELCYAT